MSRVSIDFELSWLDLPDLCPNDETVGRKEDGHKDISWDSEGKDGGGGGRGMDPRKDPE